MPRLLFGLVAISSKLGILIEVPKSNSEFVSPEASSGTSDKLSHTKDGTPVTPPKSLLLAMSAMGILLPALDL